MIAGALIDRRSFLRAAGLAFVAGLPAKGAFALSRSDAVFATGFRAPDGGFGLALMSERGEFIDRIDLPGRIHGLGYSAASGRVVAFALRPGTFALVVDVAGKAEPVIITAVDGRHFYGHGCFSPDGRRLYASENDFDGNRGVIGVYDATDGFSRIGEFPAHGIGTHDMSVSDDGGTIVIANGGIETHPDFGRTKLNLDRMEPSLVLLDARDGRLIEKHALPPELRQLSTRHLATMGDGRIWFACQYEGARTDRPPLAGSFARGEPLSFVDLPEETIDGLGNYVGAIAANRAEGLIGLSSPRSGMAVTLDARTGRLLRQERMADAAGIAPADHGFAVSSYRGDFAGHRLPVAFDQHIVRLGTI